MDFCLSPIRQADRIPFRKEIVQMCKRAVSVCFVLFFVVGIILGSSLPRTFFTHPFATFRLMSAIPLHSEVLPADTPEARELFQPWGWWEEPGLVVDYEWIHSGGQGKLICHVRTRLGTGKIIPVDPNWINRKTVSLEDSRGL